jgi:uncharacterized protein YmfQ (DUF2313 family)
VDLIQLLPSQFAENEKMIKLQGILSNNVNSLAADMGETIDQCFVSTATNVLSRYEKLYGIEVDVSKSNLFRRERIKAKIRGVGTATKNMIIDTAAAYSNGEVAVIEDAANNSFTIKFVGTKGIPLNMDGLTLTINEIKPAHLAFTFEYVFNTWNDIRGMTWNEANAYTWEGLRAK